MSRDNQISEMQNAIWCWSGCDSDESAKIAENLYDKGYRKQEWISVEDRLPEKDGTYLVHYHDDVIGEYVTTRQFWGASKIFEPMEYFEKHTGRKALHWMPLPEAPKMKGE